MWGWVQDLRFGFWVFRSWDLGVSIWSERGVLERRSKRGVCALLCALVSSRTTRSRFSTNSFSKVDINFSANNFLPSERGLLKEIVGTKLKRGVPACCCAAALHGAVVVHSYRGYSKLRTRTVLGSYSRAMPRSIGPPHRGPSLIRNAPPVGPYSSIS